MIRKVALVLIRAYQIFVSPLLRPSCRYLPTCSSYASTCIERFGVVRGSALALRRISRCHPWGASGYDPPPIAHAELKTSKTPKAPLFSRMIKVWIGKY